MRKQHSQNVYRIILEKGTQICGKFDNFLFLNFMPLRFSPNISWLVQSMLENFYVQPRASIPIVVKNNEG